MADPVHPNWDGIAFRATTDRRGVVVTPTSAQTTPPYTFLPVAEALAVATDMRSLVALIRRSDRDSYLAWFLEEVTDELVGAIKACEPPAQA